jgi:HAD superfamily hydrolase (TIGR01509 family)
MSSASSPKCSLNCRHYLFDLDGTLVDSLPVHARCFRHVLERSFPAALEHFDYTCFLGWKTLDVFRVLRLTTDSQKLKELTAAKQACYQKAVQQGQVYPFAGVKDALQLLQAKGRILYIVTGGSRRSTVELLAASGLAKYFTGVVTGDDVEMSKPHPELFLRALSQFGLRRETVLTVEDSVAGAVASERAGVAAVMVNAQNSDGGRVSFSSFMDFYAALRTALEDDAP